MIKDIQLIRDSSQRGIYPAQSAMQQPGMVAFPQFGFSQPPPEENAVPLSHYLWVLGRHKWKIIALVTLSVAAAVVVSSRLTPIYESTATIDIDRQMPSGVIGQDANRTTLNDSDQFLATQIKLIQSDSVLRPVVQKFKIPQSDIENLDGKSSGSRAQDAPVALKKLKVTRPPNTYLLLISYRSPSPALAAAVANGVAESYIEHTYNIRFRSSAGLTTFMEKQLEDLKAKMETSSTALAKFERELNLINPEEKTSILSARLLQLNTEHTNAQADRVKKQAAFDSIQAGTLEAAQASAQGEQIRRLGERMDEAKEKFASIKTQYGANHPEYKKSFSQLTELERQLQGLKKNIGQRVEVEFAEARNRESMLSRAVTDTKAEFDKLNIRGYEYKTLKQEAETDKKLYEELVRKIKEAGINASFQNSSIRLADSARPAYQAVFPDTKMNAMLALLLSLFLAVGAAIMSDVLDHTVRDPEQIQKGLGTEVIGSLPSVKSWRGRLPGVAQNASSGALVKAHQEGDSKSAAFEEAIRTLRDSILLSDLDNRPRTLLITSATPREGKTTTCVHLAVAHSLQNRKTLIVDCDLRRPSVHGRLGVPNDKGLANVISDAVDWHTLVSKTPGAPYLDVLPAGPASRRTADRIGGVLEQMLKEAMTEYDLVILDAPPLLGFAEPLQMATLVDGVVVVTLAGQTNRNAVASVLSSLKRLKANVIGVALNEVREEMSDRYYYGYHGKYYNKYYQPAKG